MENESWLDGYPDEWGSYAGRSDIDPRAATPHADTAVLNGGIIIPAKIRYLAG